jgi:hypothetical protein
MVSYWVVIALWRDMTRAHTYATRVLGDFAENKAS